jgi:hypothetical protein
LHRAFADALRQQPHVLRCRSDSFRARLIDERNQFG